MLWNISVFQFLIYAAGVGFAAAIIYTNIQRTAYSKFFTYLLDNSCFSSENAKQLEAMGLNTLEKRIVISATKHQYGFKKYVKTIGGQKNEDDIESLFRGSFDNSYYLENADTELLRKKYSFKTMPAKSVILFIAALAIVVVICSVSVSWLIDRVSAPKLEENEETKQTQQDDSNEASKSENTPEFVVPDNSDTPSIPHPENGQDKPSGPRIPV